PLPVIEKSLPGVGSVSLTSRPARPRLEMSLVLVKLCTAAAVVSNATTSPLIGARFSSQLFAVLQLVPAAPVQCNVAGVRRSSRSSRVGRQREGRFFLDRRQGVARERGMESPPERERPATGSCQ